MRKPRWICILLSVILLSGCTAGEERSSALELGSRYNLPALRILANVESLQQQPDYLKEWNQYMSEKYDTPISLSANTELWVDPYQIQLENASSLYQSIRSGSALPLEEYLKDNPNWNRLPEEFRKRFEYDGHLYGIPKSSKINLEVSSIRTDWLDHAGKSLPRTLEELMETSKSMGSGKILIGTDFAEHIDLFNAFGLYFSDAMDPRVTQVLKTSLEGYLPLAYDPQLDCVADALYKPEAEEAIRYFEELYDNGLISQDAFWNIGHNASKVAEGQYGLIYGEVAYAKYRVDETYEALPPLSTEHPVTYSIEDEVYTVNPNTENPGEVINLFVDMMFGSVEGYLDFALGLPRNYKIGSNHVITVQYGNEAEKVLPPLLGLAEFDELVLGEEYIIITPGQDAKAEKQLRQQMREYEAAYIEKYTKTGGLIQIPVWYSVIDDANYRMFKGVSYRGFNDMMMSLINPQSSGLEMLESYRRNAKEMSFKSGSPPTYVFYPEALQSINDRLGFEFKQDIQYR